ncbi:MAG: tRNA threonylcarbamoyladenosine biosynthesis protein TsaB [Kiritimatiellia bacterium]
MNDNELKMTYILALDTSTDACSVAILSPSGIKQTLSVSPREHTQRLLPSIERLLAEHELALQNVDAIAFGVGPGSFTGLRIGLSTAQGLAYGADLPLLPVSTLQTMAQTAVRLGVADLSQIIIPAIDARMKEIYWSAYRFDNSLQQVVSICEERVSAPEVLATNSLVATQNNPCAIGSGWHYEQLSAVVSNSPKLDLYPEAYDVAVLAEMALAQEHKGQGQATISPLSVEPTYIRDEVSWKKRQRIREQQV